VKTTCLFAGRISLASSLSSSASTESVSKANGRMTTYSLEVPKPIDGIKASLGRVLRRAALYQGPFLPAYVIRRHRFESGRSCTDDIAEIERRHVRDTEFGRRLKKLFDIG